MRIAIIRLSAMGDIIMSAAFLASIKEFVGRCEIDFFVDSNFVGMVENSPCIDNIRSMNFKKMFKSIGGLLSIRRYCRECGYYDIVIDMQGLIKSAIVGSFLKKACFVGFGFCGSREKLASLLYSKRVDIPYTESVLKRNFSVIFDNFGHCDIKEALKLKSSSFGIDESRIGKQLKSMVLNPPVKGQKILFVLESSTPNKQYPASSYAALADMLHGLLGKCNIYLIYHSDESNAKNLAGMLSRGGIANVMLPKMDLNEVKFCVKQMDCVVGGDTGVTHIAWAFDVNRIVMHGNTDNPKHSYKRVLIGGATVVSKHKNFDIRSIPPVDVFNVYKNEIYKGRCV